MEVFKLIKHKQFIIGSWADLIHIYQDKVISEPWIQIENGIFNDPGLDIKNRILKELMFRFIT